MGRKRDIEATMERVQAGLDLLQPMSEMIEMFGQVIICHHPEGAVAGDCLVCEEFRPSIIAINDRWEAARNRAMDAWGISQEELDEG